MVSVSEDVAIVCLTRHGHGTAKAVVQGVEREGSGVKSFVCVDIGSPAPVAEYLASEQRRRPGFSHVHFEQLVSRQQARIGALERVESEYTLLIDNNMLLEPGAIAALVDAAEETGADLVSPVIVTRGGSIHYSGGKVLRKRSLRSLGRGQTYRPQDTGATVRTALVDAELERMDIDFVESHCCLARTDSLRIPGVLLEGMHNAHTMCYAGHELRRRHGRRVVFEPAAVATIVPMACGYDLPWMLLEYMRIDRLAESYGNLTRSLGAGPGTELRQCISWHTKHLKYLLLDMLEHGRLDRDRLLDLDEVPAVIAGYDEPLPDDVDERLTAGIVPFVERCYPSLVAPLHEWLARSHR